MAGQEARDARDAGIATAAAHADAVSERWTDRAYLALVEHAQRHPVFTIEQLRAAVCGKLEEPPSRRAWGSVARRAAAAGIIAPHGYAAAEDPDVHCNLVTLWRSTKFTADVVPKRTPFRLVDTGPGDPTMPVQRPKAVEHIVSSSQWAQIRGALVIAGGSDA